MAHPLTVILVTVVCYSQGLGLTTTEVPRFLSDSISEKDLGDYTWLAYREKEDWYGDPDHGNEDCKVLEAHPGKYEWNDK